MKLLQASLLVVLSMLAGLGILFLVQLAGYVNHYPQAVVKAFEGLDE